MEYPLVKINVADVFKFVPNKHAPFAVGDGFIACTENRVHRFVSIYNVGEGGPVGILNVQLSKLWGQKNKQFVDVVDRHAFTKEEATKLLTVGAQLNQVFRIDDGREDKTSFDEIYLEKVKINIGSESWIKRCWNNSLFTLSYYSSRMHLIHLCPSPDQSMLYRCLIVRDIAVSSPEHLIAEELRHLLTGSLDQFELLPLEDARIICAEMRG